MRLLYTLISLLSFICNADAVYYKTYTASDGLPGNNVYHIYRDRAGYLWLATDNGISRFDGITFRTYTVLNGIGDNNVFNFHEDRQNRLWLYTFNGTPCFIRNDSVFNPANSPLLKRIPPHAYINAMHDDGDTALYIGYIDGMVARLQDTSYRVLLPAEQSGIRLTTIFRVHDTLRTVTGNQWIDMLHDHPVAKHIIPRCNSFLYNGHLLTVHDGMLNILKNGSTIWGRAIQLRESEVIHLYYDTAGNLFCSTRKGLLIINTHSGASAWLLKDLKVSCVEQDIYGNYWVSTFGNGIFRINSEPAAIQHICDLHAGKISFTRAGQFFYNHDGYTCTITPGGKELRIKRWDKGATESDPLYYDSTSFLYIDPKTSELAIYNTRSQHTVLLSKTVKHIYPLGNNMLLALSGNELYQLDISGRKPSIKTVVHLDERMTDFCFDRKKQRLYYLFRQSLYVYDLNTKTNTLLDTIGSSEAVAGMHIIDGHLVLPTSNRHFIIYRHGAPRNKIVLPTDEVTLFNVAAVNATTWLLYTNKGYYIIRPGAITATHTSLQELEYPFRQKDVSFLYPANENIVCNVNDALYAFDAAMLNRKMAVPALQVDKITANGTAFNSRDIIVKGKNNAHLFVTVSGPVFSNANIYYQYRLVQNDMTGAWTDEYSRGFTIPAEQHGDYRVDIRSITSNGRTSPVYSLELHITPPFYSSPVFYALVLLAAALLVYCCVHLYHTRRRKALQEEMNYLQLEHKAINSLLNPHFVFNAINNIQHLINDNDKEAANHYLATMSRMIRQNMENLQFSLIAVSKEMQLTIHYVQLQNLRFGGRIGLRTHIDIGDTEKVLVPPLLIHTFVENAIIHGFRSDHTDFIIDIELCFTTEDYLVISVRDNGTGLTKEQKKTVHDETSRTSMGIDFTRKRLQRLSDYYHVRYSLDIYNLATRGEEGTEVIIVLYGKFNELTADPVG